MKNEKSILPQDAIIHALRRKKQVAKERAKLKDEAQALRFNHTEIVKEFVTHKLEEFVRRMVQDGYKTGYNGYISQNETSDFTYHVNHSGFFINDEHYAAVQKFTEAQENLNRVFVTAMVEDEQARSRVISYSTVKNLDKI